MVTLTIYYSVFCLLIGTIHSTSAAELRYYDGNYESYVSTSLDSPLKLLKYLDKSKETVVYVFGFNSDTDGKSTKAVLSAYLKQDRFNVLLLDWSKEAKVFLTQIEYPVVILKAKEVASDFGEALVELIKNGIPANTIRLCGHSLGAHLVGWAGKKVQESKYILSRIIGLDPAGPLFSCAIGFDGLKPSSAAFVEVLHTNPGKYGADEPLGTVDFWANCDEGSVQPGCSNKHFKKESCSHSRACFIHAEAISTSSVFLAQGSSSCKSWKSNHISDLTARYGDDTSLHGNFYFSTNSEYPYAKGKNGLTPCED